jgi:hypothetical protein
VFQFYDATKQEETFFITIEKVPLTVNIKPTSQSRGTFLVGRQKALITSMVSLIPLAQLKCIKSMTDHRE